MHIWSWLLFVNIATGAQGLRGQGEFAAVGSQGSSQLSRSVPSIPTLKIQRRLRPSNVNPYAWNGIEPSYGSSKRRLLPTPVKREAPPAISGAPPTQSLSEPIDDAGGDISYFAEVKLGSSGKPVYLLLDTGASNTWVMDSSCSACTPNHNTFGQADSHTLQSTQTNFDLSYGIGEVSGTVVTDTIALAGLNFTLFFGSADTVSSDFVAHPSDGILGLGQAQTDSTGHPTFMQALSQSKAVSSNLFGINLERASDGTTDGEINFGAPDTSKYTGDINFSDTISDGMLWEINIDDAIVDGVPCNFTGKSAVVDTGTSYALIPPDDAQIIHSLIPGSASNGAGFQVPCGSTTTVQVKIGGITYGIESEDYVGGNPTAGNKLCDSNLVSKNALGSPDKWILGDLFLKNVYSIWNFDNSQIGLAIKSTSSSSPSSKSSSSSSSSSTATSSASSSPSSSLITTTTTSSASSASSSSPSEPDPLDPGLQMTSSSDATSTSVSGSAVPDTSSTASGNPSTTPTPNGQKTSAAIVSRPTSTCVVIMALIYLVIYL